MGSRMLVTQFHSLSLAATNQIAHSLALIFAYSFRTVICCASFASYTTTNYHIFSTSPLLYHCRLVSSFTKSPMTHDLLGCFSYSCCCCTIIVAKMLYNFICGKGWRYYWFHSMISPFLGASSHEFLLFIEQSMPRFATHRALPDCSSPFWRAFGYTRIIMSVRQPPLHLCCIVRLCCIDLHDMTACVCRP